MVGTTDISRCCCGCEIIEDGTAAATVCTGTWSNPSSGKYRPSGANAVRLYDSTGAGSRPWIATVQFDVAASGSPASVGARLIGGASDCDNYVFCEWRVVDGGSNSVQFRLGQVVAGVETILAEAPRTLGATTGGCAAYEESLTWSGTKSRIMTLCWDGAALIADLALAPANTGYTKRLQSNDATVPGSRAGYASGAYSSISTLDFYNFALSLSHSDTKADCEACPVHCCLGTVPDELIFEMSGIGSELIDVSDMVNGTSACYFDCELFEGTWYLEHSTCPGDSGCQWGLLVDDSYYLDCGCVGLGLCDDVLFTYSITAQIVTVSGVRYIQVSFGITSYGLGSTNSTWTLGVWRAATDDPCEDWSDWITLTKYSGVYCTFSGYTPTVRIKKA